MRLLAHQWGPRGLIRTIFRQARWLTRRDGELRLRVGSLALMRHRYDVAVWELSHARRADRTRPLSLSALALAEAERSLLKPEPHPLDAEALLGCVKASTASMIREYAPDRDDLVTDFSACALIALAVSEAGLPAMKAGSFRDWPENHYAVACQPAYWQRLTTMADHARAAPAGMALRPRSDVLEHAAILLRLAPTRGKLLATHPSSSGRWKCWRRR